MVPVDEGGNSKPRLAIGEYTEYSGKEIYEDLKIYDDMRIYEYMGRKGVG